MNKKRPKSTNRNVAHQAPSIDTSNDTFLHAGTAQRLQVELVKGHAWIHINSGGHRSGSSARTAVSPTTL